MSYQLAVVLFLLAGAILMFAINRPRMDVVALNMLIAFPFTGVITMGEALAGFSDSNMDIKGKAAHAGLTPDKGISAMLVAAVALTEARRAAWFGKVVNPNAHGTSNAGVFSGNSGKSAGDATNVVTDYVHIKGEARSPDLSFAHAIAEGFREAFEKARAEIKDADGGTAEIKFLASHAYPPFNLDTNSPAVQRAIRATESIGMKPNTVFSNGGLDANWLVKHGLPTVSFGAGQNEVHTVKEFVDLPEFANGCRLAVALATLEG